MTTNATCTARPCRRVARTRGLCRTHLAAARAAGQLPLSPHETPRWIIDTDTGCWNWTRKIHSTGYGRIGQGDKVIWAHRWSYEHHVGPIPDGLFIDHLCRNTKCVNPAHLEPVTNRENVLRGVGFAAVNHAKTHCIHGHEFTPDNTILRPGPVEPWRECRTCRRATNRKTDAKRRARRGKS